MMLGVTNFANVAVALELRLNLRYVYISAASWAIVWLAGVVLAFLAAGYGEPHD
jgi:hypothetical protein